MKINYSVPYRAAIKLHSFLPFKLGLDRAIKPVHVQIELTHRCNLNCPMCFQNRKMGRSQEMDTEEIKSIIDRLPFWTMLSLTGGEPFMREDIEEILAYALDRKKCNIVTNAALLTEAQVDLIIKKRLLLLSVSLDGIGTMHDAVRNKPGLYEKVVGVIGKIQEKKKKLNTNFPLIDIKTIILKENISQLGNILALAESLGADFLSLSLPKIVSTQFSEPYRKELSDVFDADPVYPVPLSSDELELLEKQLSSIKRHKGRTIVRFYPFGMLEEGAVRKYYEGRLVMEDFGPCAMPWSILCVSPHGDVYPCLSYRIGNARKNDLIELWNSKRFREFRHAMDRKKLAKYCLGCCYSVYRKNREKEKSGSN